MGVCTARLFWCCKWAIVFVRDNRMHSQGPNKNPEEILVFFMSEILIANNVDQLQHTIIDKMGETLTSELIWPWKFVDMVVMATRLHSKCLTRRPREILAFLKSKILITKKEGELLRKIIAKTGVMCASRFVWPLKWVGLTMSVTLRIELRWTRAS